MGRTSSRPRFTQSKGIARGLLCAVTFLAACAGDKIGHSPATLQVEPEVQFGTVAVGLRQTAKLHVQNIGRTALHLKGCHLAFPAPEDFTVTGADDQTLLGGEGIEITVSFGPMVVGRRAAKLVLPTDSPVTPTTEVPLDGEGILGKADLAENNLDFGKVELNASETLQLHLKNTESTPATVRLPDVTGDDAIAFRSSVNGTQTVPPNSTQAIDVTFVPTRLGAHSAHLLVQPCPSCAPIDVALTGEGIAATLVADPTSLDFGHVSPGNASMLPLKLTNIGSEPVQLTGTSFGQSTSSDFTVDMLPTGGVQLKTNDSYTFHVTFKPSSLSSQKGTLRIQTSDAGTPVVVIPLSGLGGGPQIQVVPNALGFPRTGVAIPVQKNVVVHNVGSDPQNMNPLVVTAVSIQGAEFTWSLPTGLSLPASINAGRSLQVNVTYTGTAAHTSTGTLVISSTDSAGHPFPDVSVPLTASAAVLGPCSYEVTPTTLDFGSVATGQQAQLAFAVRNTGTNDCAIANIRLSLATPPEFGVTEVSSRLIPAGGQYVVPVEFAPDSQMEFQGAVLFDMSSPTAPQGTVALQGGGVDPCLEINPTQLLFGQVGLQCQPPTKNVTVTNSCSQAVTVNSATIGAMNTPFTLSTGIAAPVTLQPGSSVQLGVTYTPKVEAMDSAPLYIQATSATNPYLVSLMGDAEAMPTQTDTYHEAPISKVDFLFVIDNSGSMADKQDNIANNANAFLQTMIGQNIDFHVAVTTTGLYPYDGGWATCPGGAHGGEDGRFFPVDNSRPRILTNATPNLSSMFAQNVKVGICHWWEEGLEAARLALSPPLINNAKDPNTSDPNDGNVGFLRDDAKLYVFYISDANDSDTTPVQMYIDQLRGLKPGRPDMVSVSAAIGLPSCDHIESVGDRYMQVVHAFGGIVADICTTDWGGLLAQVAQNATSPTTVFPLSQSADPSQITVTVDGNPVNAMDGSQTNWTFDKTIGAFGAVVFDPSDAPMSNQVVQITYPVPCPTP